MVTEVFVYTSGVDRYSCVIIRGHAGYRRKGTDIVCAAISAIINGTINFLQENYPNQGSINCSSISTEIVIYLTGDASSDYHLCLKMMINQLSNISSQYPDYLMINEREGQREN